MYGGAGIARDLSTLNVNGIHIPIANLTLYPDSGAGKGNINLELRTRLTIDEIAMRNSSGAADFKVSGIHFAEAFYSAWGVNPLPSHKNTTGSTPTPANWDTNYDSWMYSGYFLFGNLNQLNFDDLKMETWQPGGDLLSFEFGKQLYNRPNTNPEGSPYFYDHKTDTLHTPVWIEPNPIAFNLGIRNSATPNIWNGYSYISLTGGLHGSIRISSLQGWNGTEFGPAAIDGLRVKYLKLEFPGGYQRDFATKINNVNTTFGWHEKGRVLEQQKTWLAANAAAVPTPPTASADGTLQWLLTPP